MDEAGGRITRQELEAVLREACQFYQRESQCARARSPRVNEKRRKRHSVRAGDLGAAGHTHGGGAEMALVIIHFCLESESLAAQMRHLWFAPTRSRSRAEHALVLVGDGVDLTDNDYKIGTLGSDERSNGVWVIDGGLNIVCRAHEFRRRMWERLCKAATRGRVGQLIRFGADLLESELSLHRAIGYDFPRR
jgi:hypothetical protein